MLNLYVREINDYKLLTEEDEKEISNLLKSENEEVVTQAKERLIKSNLKLVVKIAHDFKGFGLSFEDLVCEGNVGLVTAADKFDYDKGAKFSTYAAFWIKAQIRTALVNKARVIRIPVITNTNHYKMQDKIVKLKEKLGREPSIGEIADAIGLTIKQTRKLLQIDNGVISLSAHIKDGEDGEIGDIIEDTKVIDPAENHARKDDNENLKMLMESNLTEREKIIIAMRFGFYDGEIHTLDEVSEKVGLTKERVRQVQKDTLRKMKKIIENNK